MCLPLCHSQWLSAGVSTSDYDEVSVISVVLYCVLIVCVFLRWFILSMPIGRVSQPVDRITGSTSMTEHRFDQPQLLNYVHHTVIQKPAIHSL